MCVFLCFNLNFEIFQIYSTIRKITKVGCKYYWPRLTSNDIKVIHNKVLFLRKEIMDIVEAIFLYYILECCRNTQNIQNQIYHLFHKNFSSYTLWFSFSQQKPINHSQIIHILNTTFTILLSSAIILNLTIMLCS